MLGAAGRAYIQPISSDAHDHSRQENKGIETHEPHNGMACAIVRLGPGADRQPRCWLFTLCYVFRCLQLLKTFTNPSVINTMFLFYLAILSLLPNTLR